MSRQVRQVLRNQQQHLLNNNTNATHLMDSNKWINIEKYDHNHKYSVQYQRIQNCETYENTFSV